MERCATVLCALVLLAGCDDDVVPRRDLGLADLSVADLAGAADLASGDLASSDAAAPSVTATVRAHPDNVVSALVDVVVSGADSVWVESGDTTAYGNATPPIALSGGAATLTIPVIGLTAGAVNHLRVIAQGAAGQVQSGDLTLATGTLPPSFAGLTITTSIAPFDGYLLIGFTDFVGHFSAAAMIDHTARVVWYRVITGTTRGLDFERLKNGNFMAYQVTGPDFEEQKLDGTKVHLWFSPAPLGADGHDFVQLPNQHVMLLGFDRRSFDTRPYFDAGVPDAQMYDNTIDEIDPDGGTGFHWASWPTILPDEIVNPDPGFDPSAFELLHPNALGLTPDGNLVASFRLTNSIVKIDRSTAQILWHLGGTKNDFTFVDDPLNGFSKQHDPHYLPNGDLLLVDNGNDQPPTTRETRTLEYRLDETNQTATLVWSYLHDPPIFSVAGGSARRLPNGDTIVSFAAVGVVTQIDPFATVKWELTSDYFIYRAIPVPTLYP
jgi:hypothetical protein